MVAGLEAPGYSKYWTQSPARSLTSSHSESEELDSSAFSWTSGAKTSGERQAKPSCSSRTTSRRRSSFPIACLCSAAAPDGSSMWWTSTSIDPGAKTQKPSPTITKSRPSCTRTSESRSLFGMPSPPTVTSSRRRYRSRLRGSRCRRRVPRAARESPVVRPRTRTRPTGREPARRCRGRASSAR